MIQIAEKPKCTINPDLIALQKGMALGTDLAVHKARQELEPGSPTMEPGSMAN